MYFKRTKRPHIENMPDRHEGYRLEIWRGLQRIEDSGFDRLFTDDEIRTVYSDALARYPNSDILVFDVLVESTRKYVPVPAEEALK